MKPNYFVYIKDSVKKLKEIYDCLYITDKLYVLAKYRKVLVGFWKSLTIVVLNCVWRVYCEALFWRVC